MLNYFRGEWSERRPRQDNVNHFCSLGPRLCLYDLGSSGGTPPPFCWVLDGLTLVNFEPDSRAESETTGQNLPVAIGPPHMRTLYINRRQTTSSLLRPCYEVVDRYDFGRMFPDQPQIFETIGTTEVDTLGLDEVVRVRNLPPPDFMKIDVQGLTLEVLESGEATLKESTLGLQAEVEFVESYLGQKTFGVIHEHLLARGFEIFRLTNLNRWPFKTSLPLTTYTGQDVFCDLLYLRSLRHVEACPEFWTPHKIVQFLRLCLLHDLTDTAAAYLERFVAKKLIDPSSLQEIERLIIGWTTCLDFFFYPRVGPENPSRGIRSRLSRLKSLIAKALRRL